MELRSTDALTGLEDHVDIWLLDPTNAGPNTDYERWLVGPEVERYARITHAGTKRDYVLSRWLVRSTLSRYYPLRPEHWRFRFNEHGRPDVANEGVDPRFSFNLSHTHGLIALGCALVPETGVDVEDPGRSTDIESISRRFFSDEEYRRLSALPDDRRRRAFFELWTLKEAYLKARGLGMSVPLKEAEIQPTDRGKSRFGPSLADGGEWFFATFERPSGHVLAVATRSAPRELRIVGVVANRGAPG